MAKNDNAHSLRMVENIEKIVGEAEAKAFEEAFPLSKSADIEKKFKWAKAGCEYLEQKFEQEQIMQIRQGCICNDGRSTASKMLQYISKTDGIAEFVRMFNEKESFAKLEYISDNKLLFCYPECYCACVKRVNEPLSEIWCYCTLGYAKALFSQVFQGDIKVELLESIKKGNERCVVSVEWN